MKFCVFALPRAKRMTANPTSPTEKASQLRQALARQGGLLPSPEAQVVSTGAAALDRRLPLGGLRRGSLAEYLGDGVSLALAAAWEACRERADGQGRVLVVVDRRRELYPAGWPLDLSRVVLLRPANDADELWACDQALRCVGVGAVVVRIERLDPHDFRRLQLAAEEGRTLGLLVRPAGECGHPSWADIRWLVEPRPSPGRRRLHATLLRCRGGTAGVCTTLEHDEATGWREVDDENALPVAAELAGATAAGRRTQA